MSGDNDRPVLDQINLVVRDMDAMLAFYRTLGVEIGPTLPQWEHHHRTASTPGGLDFDLGEAMRRAVVQDQGCRRRIAGAERNGEQRANVFLTVGGGPFLEQRQHEDIFDGEGARRQVGWRAGLVRCRNGLPGERLRYAVECADLPDAVLADAPDGVAVRGEETPRDPEQCRRDVVDLWGPEQRPGCGHYRQQPLLKGIALVLSSGHAKGL